MSGSEDRSGGDNRIQFINIGRVGDKVLKNGDEKWGVGGRVGGRVGNRNILTFYATGSTKRCDFKKLHFGQFFLFVFVKFIDFFTGLKGL